jgi:hypothetical protein
MIGLIAKSYLDFFESVSHSSVGYVISTVNLIVGRTSLMLI